MLARTPIESGAVCGVADVHRGPQLGRARGARDAVGGAGGDRLRLGDRDVRDLRGGILGDRGRRDDQRAGACEHGHSCEGAEHPDVYRAAARRSLEPVTRKPVMNWTHVRSRDVNEAVAERMPVRAGTESETFAALYERTFPRVYAYVASLLRDRSAAEDVTAQAFERAYRKRASYRARRGSLEAWLFGIARNAALDELRRRGRRAGLETEPADTDVADRRGPRRAGAAPRGGARRRWPRSTATSATCSPSSSPAASRTPRSRACSACPRRTPAPACTAP